MGPAGQQQAKACAPSRRSRAGAAFPKGATGATTTPDYSLSGTSSSQPQIVEGEETEGASLPLALLARDAQKMRAAAELLNAWQIAPHDLWCGELLGRGGCGSAISIHHAAISHAEMHRRERRGKPTQRKLAH